MRDEVLAGIDWFKTFFSGLPIQKYMRIEEFSLFHPSNDERPYEFLFELYAMRKRLKITGDHFGEVHKAGNQFSLWKDGAVCRRAWKAPLLRMSLLWGGNNCMVPSTAS
jgi:hypothetical protein